MSSKNNHITIIGNNAYCELCKGTSIFVRGVYGLKYWKWMKKFKSHHKKCIVRIVKK